jgi:HD-like signal output (HDOD) protein
MKESQSLVEIIREHSASDRIKLPVFPVAAVELQNLVSRDNYAIQEFAEIVSKDQTLAGYVLKLANSAFYSGFKKVHTIADAVMRFGTSQIINCVILMGQSQCYRSKNSMINDYLGDLWKHALICGLGTKWILGKIGAQHLREEGLLAGLLHDIGKLLLLKVVESLIEERATDFSDAFIFEVLESLHAQEGCDLMERWNVPEVYCRVARDHHREDFDPEDTILLAVRVVNQACRKLGIGMYHDESILLAMLPEVPQLGIREITLAELEVALEDALSVHNSLDACAA